jgi:histidinol phosphatase-like enzyme
MLSSHRHESKEYADLRRPPPILMDRMSMHQHLKITFLFVVEARDNGMEAARKTENKGSALRKFEKYYLSLL